jgi:2-methylcitrate dehydratase PrpD
MVEVADGRILTSEIRHSKGTLQNPMSGAEVEQKFAELAAGSGADGAARGLIDVVSKLELLEDAKELGSAIRDGWMA